MIKKLTCLASLLLFIGNASANLVLVEFSGTVGEVPSILAPKIFSGDSFKALVIYNTETPMNNMYDDLDTTARYWDPYIQVAMRIGTYEINVPDASILDHFGVITVVNDATVINDGIIHTSDHLRFKGHGNIRNYSQTINGYSLANFMFSFGDYSGTALALDSLDLPSDLDLKKFTNEFTSSSAYFRFVTGSPIQTDELYFFSLPWSGPSITRVKLIEQAQAPIPIPIPGALWLMGSALLGLLSLRMRDIY